MDAKKINYTAALPPNKQLMTASEENQLYKTYEGEKQASAEEEPLYANVGINSSFKANDQYRMRAVSEESQSGKMSDDDRFTSSTEEGWFKETIVGNKMKEHSENNQLRAHSEEVQTRKLSEPLYSNDFENKSIRDSIYKDPFEEARMSFSATSYDVDPQSARSSLSTSSYVTATGASNSSISTLQDEQMPEIGYSDDENWHSRSNMTPRGSTTLKETTDHDKLEKHQSMTLPNIPTEDLFKKVEKKRKPRKWFSLRSKN